MNKNTKFLLHSPSLIFDSSNSAMLKAIVCKDVNTYINMSMPCRHGCIYAHMHLWYPCMDDMMHACMCECMYGCMPG